MSPAHKSKKKRRNITQSRSKKGVGTRGFERDGFVFASVSCILRSNISVRIYKCYITFGLSFMQIFHPPHTLPKDEMCFYEKRKKSAGVLVAAKRTLLLLQLGTTFRFVRASQPQLCNRPRLRREKEFTKMPEQAGKALKILQGEEKEEKVELQQQRRQQPKPS